MTIAAEGGIPVRSTFLPYGRHEICETDIEAVTKVLGSGFLTTGPSVDRFEEELSHQTGAQYSAVVSSGTAALHAAMKSLDIGPGHEVIVPAITFAATANAVLYCGARPVFVDINPDNLLMDLSDVERKITKRTKMIVPVDFAGHPCDYDELNSLAESQGIALISDSSHALGATYNGDQIGSVSNVSTLSFHPVKHVAAGEGGAVITNDRSVAEYVRRFRNHGIGEDHKSRMSNVKHQYDIIEQGYNYRMSDIHCALALSQLDRLESNLRRRREIAAYFDDNLNGTKCVEPLAVSGEVGHAYHLYIVKLKLEHLKVDRDTIFRALRSENIGVHVHYMPVYWHSAYRSNGYELGLCPVAEQVYGEILTLPMFPGMGAEDCRDVMTALHRVLDCYSI